MSALIIVFGFLVVLFILAFLFNRRFGVLGLSLAAGYIIYNLWSSKLSDFIAFFELPDLGIVSARTVVGLAIIILPSLILLLGGPSYKTTYGRLIGSLGYAVLATLFCVNALLFSLPVFAEGKIFFDFIKNNEEYIITVALIMATIDAMHLYSGSKILKKSQKAKE